MATWLSLWGAAPKPLCPLVQRAHGWRSAASPQERRLQPCCGGRERHAGQRLCFISCWDQRPMNPCLHLVTSVTSTVHAQPVPLPGSVPQSRALERLALAARQVHRPPGALRLPAQPRGRPALLPGRRSWLDVFGRGCGRPRAASQGGRRQSRCLGRPRPSSCFTWPVLVPTLNLLEQAAPTQASSLLGSSGLQRAQPHMV